MNKKNIGKIIAATGVIASVITAGVWESQTSFVEASSHREAPLIANDPLTDNTDLYAFRSPDDQNFVTIIANYVPLQLPQGGPNYASFGENIRYEVHIENGSALTPTANVVNDDITYRFTFTKVNQDASTFFNIRLGMENLKTSYVCEKSVNGGAFTTIVTSGVVPPANIGPRSISGGAGLNVANYDALMTSAITNATGGGGEIIYCGPSDDPFFVDLGGIFDLGQTRQGGTGVNAPVDGVACKNVHSIAIKVPIATLQKTGQPVSAAANILDPNYVIGVWASASRKQVRTLTAAGTETYTGTWVQVSRIGMPLTNEAVIPLGSKDKWNSLTPYTEDAAMEAYFCNPELGLYMADGSGYYGTSVPALAALRTQSLALGSFDFRNGKAGLFPLKSNVALAGTALDDALFGNYLLKAASPRSVDLLPIFHAGVPNLPPYQLATGKPLDSPLSPGKPFINNFLPSSIGGDMLRLNMAVPSTPRNDPNFSSLGLVQAAVLGLTNPTYSGTAIQFIPNMDGFPNGRRLEDDVTTIELQAVGGVVLAAVGLWYDDYVVGSGNVVTAKLGGVLGYNAGITKNDTTFKATFPYVQAPWSGYGKCGGPSAINGITTGIESFASNIGISAPSSFITNFPNPAKNSTTFSYRIADNATVILAVYDINGRLLSTLVNKKQDAGSYELNWNVENLVSGTYFASLITSTSKAQTIKIVVAK